MSVSVTRHTPEDGPEVLTLNWDDRDGDTTLITRDALEGLLAELNAARALLWAMHAERLRRV